MAQKQYFKVLLGEGKDRPELWVKASDMFQVEIWVLRNRPMEEYYGMNVIQVDPVTKESFRGADFSMNAVADYYRQYVYPGKSDEEIRKLEIESRIRAYNRMKGVA